MVIVNPAPTADLTIAVLLADRPVDGDCGGSKYRLFIFLAWIKKKWR
jgi:hypothetical protein